MKIIKQLPFLILFCFGEVKASLTALFEPLLRKHLSSSYKLRRVRVAG